MRRVLLILAGCFLALALAPAAFGVDADQRYRDRDNAQRGREDRKRPPGTRWAGALAWLR